MLTTRSFAGVSVANISKQKRWIRVAKAKREDVEGRGKAQRRTREKAKAIAEYKVWLRSHRKKRKRMLMINQNATEGFSKYKTILCMYNYGMVGSNQGMSQEKERSR